MENTCIDYCHSDKKDKNYFLIYKEIQKTVVAKSYITSSLIIYG